MPKDTYSDILGLVARALSHPVGIKVPTMDPEAFRQRIERGLRALMPGARPPLSFLTRHTPSGPQVWLVRQEFMNGKKLDDRKVREALAGASASASAQEGDGEGPREGLPGSTG